MNGSQSATRSDSVLNLEQLPRITGCDPKTRHTGVGGGGEGEIVLFYLPFVEYSIKIVFSQ